MILYAHLIGHDKRERIVLSYDVEKDAAKNGMTLEKYLEEIMQMNPRFERVYCR